MYENYQNTLCINQEVFYDNLAIVSYTNFQNWVKRGKINKIRTAGRGRTGLIEFSSIPEDLKNLIIRTFGNPYLQNDRVTFTNQLATDYDAIDFYKTYVYEDGRGIPNNRQEQYICEAEILNLYNSLIEKYDVKVKQQRRKSKKGELKKKLSTIINDLKTECFPNTQTKKYPHNLPSNVRALDRKANGYSEESYDFLVHKNAGNKAAQKIKGDVANWLLAQYSMPNKIVVPVLHSLYNREAEIKGWPELSESAIYKWLYEPTQEKIWLVARDTNEYKNKYGHKLVRDKEQWFPNAYWAIDGSKIDWMHYYDNQLGAAAKFKIDPVIDVYSEKIIGWSFSETESHIDHFNAVKMAFNESQSRPYLFTYDGQSGHTSNRMQELYGKMVAKKGGVHYKHAAYEHSSPVEGIFNRLQQQVINSYWFSDKQSITVRTEKNKPNMDFIMANKHKLPNKEELLKAWKLCVSEWNEAKHPKYNKSRNEVYQEEQFMKEEVSYLDLIDLFWVYTPDTVTYKADGLKVQIANQKYHFEVYNINGDIDLRFRERWVNKKFFVKYDPDNLDNYVSLYLKLPDGDKQFVADAQPVRKQQQVPVLMQPGDKEQWQKDFEVRKVEEAAAKKQIEQIQRETGITPEQLIVDQELKIKFGGKLPKQQRSDVEAESFYHRM
ncbi:DDE-type integrase/transposase/recombinase [Winogradskyella phage Peternella_1]|uniref:DDE-type integrase/transposase/recombinase n=1 Tax=Winogradskyella phage Peternella_1 TaxID=2745699 RepID=A0A8E5EBM8_9CAUD|nr:transposase [Winogradskyella phage Peternella_1]QQV91539.1 DDE-type integrase/transposase/recombinase [Winogradskyella phage Peternella_1]